MHLHHFPQVKRLQDKKKKKLFLSISLQLLNDDDRCGCYHRLVMPMERKSKSCIHAEEVRKQVQFVLLLRTVWAE